MPPNRAYCLIQAPLGYARGDYSILALAIGLDSARPQQQSML